MLAVNRDKGDDEILAPKDAGAILTLGTSRMQQLDREGKLRAIRDSAGRRLYRKADVLAFRDKRRQVRNRA